MQRPFDCSNLPRSFGKSIQGEENHEEIFGSRNSSRYGVRSAHVMLQVLPAVAGRQDAGRNDQRRSDHDGRSQQGLEGPAGEGRDADLPDQEVRARQPRRGQDHSRRGEEKGLKPRGVHKPGDRIQVHAAHRRRGEGALRRSQGHDEPALRRGEGPDQKLPRHEPQGPRQGRAAHQAALRRQR